MIGQLFCSKNKIPHIVTVMGQEAVKKNKYIKFLKPTTTIISLSEQHKMDLYKYRSINSKVIPFAIDESEFPDFKERTTDILGVGSLIPVKNYSDFIKVVELLIVLFPNIKVKIVGGGIEENNLRNLVKEKKLDNNIAFTGLIQRSEVLNIMAKSKILLHTSKYESYGYVFSEALYSGMHIVSYEVGIASQSECWNIGDNVKDLFQFCQNVLKQKKYSYKRIKIHDLDVITNDYVSIYQSLINRS